MQQVIGPAREAGVSTAKLRPESFSTRAIIAADRFIYRFAGRWLTAFNTVLVAWALAVLVAPLLTAIGRDGAARPIYGFFALFCHQDPDRSFHVFGEKLACCERCAAIYGSIATFGLLFGLVRVRIRAPRYAELLALVLPVVLDGMAVGAGLYNGNAVVRVTTGGLFGLALIWFLYPKFDRGFAAMRTRIEALFERLVAQGRAQPLVS